MSITASCRWRTRPTAGSPTRSTCSSACRRSRSAPRSGCASTTTCWPTASRRKSAGSTARPQALSQCRNWLAKNLPHATLHEVSSTADAAELVQTEPNAAAVASRQAAVRYGLQDAVPQHRGLAVQRDALRRHRPPHDSARTGNDKTAMMFQISHTPGALADVPGRVQAEQDQPDLDRIVPVPRRPRANTSSSSTSTATATTRR